MKTTHEMTESVIKSGRKILRWRRALKTAAGAVFGAGIVTGAFFLGMTFPERSRGVDLVESSPDSSAGSLIIVSAETSELSLLSEEGTKFRAIANSAAIAFMRNDREELSKYLADPGYCARLNGGTDLFDNMKYTITVPADDNYGTLISDNSGVFDFEYSVDIRTGGGIMRRELCMGLKKCNDEWKVVYIELE